MNVSVKSISQSTGLSWGAVFMFSLLLAFILYTASIGSLSKYKAFLFSSVPSELGASNSATAIPQGQGVDAQTEAAIQKSVANAQNNNSALGGLQTGLEVAGTVAMFL